jgi:hypothetical protein
MTDDNTANDVTPETDAEATAPDAAADTTDTQPAGEDAGTATVEGGEGGEQPSEGAPVEEKPREVIRGIHPELRCEDPECAPEFTELQFFSPEEASKTKGKIMLFCARSGKKYFAPAVELQTWIAENKVAKTGRGRKEG